MTEFNMRDWALRPSSPDERDYIYENKVMKPKLTAGVRPRRVMNKNFVHWAQGDFGTCGGHAVGYSGNLRQGVEMSRLMGYYNAKVVDQDFAVEGTDIRSLMIGWLTFGICKEELYPYSNYKVMHQFPPISEAAMTDMAVRKIEAYSRLVTLDEMLDAIWRYKSIVGGFLVFDNFYTPHEGFISLPNGTFHGGHALNISGYDLDLEHTFPNGEYHKGFFWIDNSWGKDWGLEGGAWIPFDYIFNDMDWFDCKFGWDFFVPIEHYPASLEWKVMDVPVITENGRTFTPVRYVAEALGATVQWVVENNQVLVNSPDKSIVFTIDSNQYWVNSELRTMDVAPFVRNDRTYLPARYVTEALGGYVKWDANEQRVDAVVGQTEVSMWIGQTDYVIKKLV